MTRSSLRARTYRVFAKALSQLLDRRVGEPLRESNTEPAKGECAWFHAASAGELESLALLAERWAKNGGRVVLSVFSASGSGQLARLVARIEAARPGSVLASGLSPREGFWNRNLERFRARVFVTAKYEAWPELWMALAERETPLVVIGAVERKSLRGCAAISKLLGSPLPPMVLITADGESVAGLRGLFPRAEVFEEGEPRWDRVAERLSGGSTRVAELAARYAGLPRPWGVFGSAWASDVAFWASNIKDLPGTLWVVPHRVDDIHCGKIEEAIRAAGIGSWVRSSNKNEAKADCRCVLVDEAGFLLELYGHADYAYVGGGFEDGVHSTIEPALAGIPIASGPKNSDRFPEVGQLQKSGQLRILNTRGEAQEWAKNLETVTATDRHRWKSESLARLGATERVHARVVKIVEAGSAC